MFVNVDWFFFSHRMPIAMNANLRNVEMSVYTDITQRKDLPQFQGFNLLQSPLSRSSKNYLLFFLEIFKAYFLILKFKPNLIHAVTIKPIIFLGIVSRITGTPFIGAISGLGPVFSQETFLHRIRLNIVMLIYKFIFKPNTSIIICQNLHDRDVLKRFGVGDEASIFIIPGSGVDLEKFKPLYIEEKVPVILMASRILLEKGVYEFCNAAKSFNKTNQKAKFLLAGPIDSSSPNAISETDIRAICEDCGVDYLGDRNDLNILLATASIFVLPSYYPEGVPKVLLEAAASGTAIITTDHPGCRDAIVDQKTGIIVEPKNSTALELAITRLLNEPKTLMQMGKAGRILAEKLFDEKKVVETHYSLYEKFASKRKD